MPHSPQAIDVSRATGWDLDRWAESHGWASVGIGPVGQLRDSDALERSNFAAARAILDAAGARYDAVTFGHWAVGWVEDIAYDAGDPATVAAVEGIAARLADYPCLDELEWSRLEWADAHPDGRYCYSDDPDCGCDLPRA
jgi:hypothetical protein